MPRDSDSAATAEASARSTGSRRSSGTRQLSHRMLSGARDVAYCLMIEYELAGNDLGEVRFAISPLNELTLSLRTLRDPGRFPLQLPWLRATARLRADLDLELLGALTNESLWTPDFLNPRPYTPL